jgi:putative ABC transport system permease protein
LLGLVSFAAEQRTKEIGIRKVLGAPVSRIIILLLKDFLPLVALAFLITLPVAYILLNRWLDSFAYSVETSWWIFLNAGLATFLVALLTLSYQTLKAALANPVKSLRYE